MSYYGDYSGSMRLEPYDGSDISLPRFSRIPRESNVLNQHRFRNFSKTDRKSHSDGRERMLQAACVILILSLIAVVVCAVFLVIGEMEAKPEREPITTLQHTWSEWGTWRDCSATCGSGSRSRHRLCYLATDEFTTATADHGNCSGAGVLESQSSTCDLQNCSKENDSPAVDGFVDHPLDTTYIFTCKDDTHSINVGSGSHTCPVARLDQGDNTFSSFNATCSQAREEHQMFTEYGGSYFGRSGYVTSPLHPLPYPDQNDTYHWTLVTDRSEIQLRLLTLYTDDLTGSCDNRSAVKIFCGIDLSPDNPSFGPFCGHSTERPTLQCNSSCALVKFQSYDRFDHNATGFHIAWSTN